MYLVVLSNFTNGTQTVVYNTVRPDEARDVCEARALQIVLDKEGEKYLQRNPWGRTKSTLLKGYNIVRSKSPFFKFTIYEKEPNGVFFAGDVRKLYTMTIVRAPHTPRGEIRPNKMSTDAKISMEAVFLELITLPRFETQDD